MANITRTWKWAEYVPDIGENRSLERPFYVRVKSGLTKLELQEFHEAIAKLRDEGFAAEASAALGKYIEMGEEPLTINGTPVTDLSAYVQLLEGVSGMEPLTELITAVTWHNSVEGARALFSERLSGGTAFMQRRSNGRAAPPKDGR